MKRPRDDQVQPTPVRRRRGLARMALVLDAAATEFAAVGYDRATTNSIAERAQISPGSLYQYFSDKAAIASALAQRYVNELVVSQAGTFSELGDELAALPLPEVIERIIDPLIAFNVQHPAFLILFARKDVPELLSGAVQPMEDAFAGRIADVIQRRNPSIPKTRIDAVTETSILVFRGLMIGVSTLVPEDRERRATEAKAAITGYLQHRSIL
ncbi:TetR/AcrR family transcriptional regulator [Microbacterium sp. A8/3-1]|uniref:TetR/AcrR family transcriptional regulator n=1 Tax=Microbacterium sp. A8/3-1 TaxID=3160749 RepID=A0AAU7W414_9MICO